MKGFVRTVNGWFIAGILAVFYLFAVGLSFLILKIRGLAPEKKKGGWTKTQPLEEKLTSSY